MDYKSYYGSAFIGFIILIETQIPNIIPAKIMKADINPI